MILRCEFGYYTLHKESNSQHIIYLLARRTQNLTRIFCFAKLWYYAIIPSDWSFDFFCSTWCDAKERTQNRFIDARHTHTRTSHETKQKSLIIHLIILCEYSSDQGCGHTKNQKLIYRNHIDIVHSIIYFLHQVIPIVSSISPNLWIFFESRYWLQKRETKTQTLKTKIILLLWHKQTR